MQPTKRIKIVFRNRFFAAIRFFLPRNVMLKFMVRGRNCYSFFFIGVTYLVRVRHVDFWRFRDRIFFRILSA